MTTLTAQPWQNGGGSTLLVARNGDDTSWSWRVSVATEAVGPFSVFADTRRQFVPIDRPVTLRFDHAVKDVLRLQTLNFDGADAPHCELPEGPTRAVNLMLRGDAEGTLIARTLVGSMMLPGAYAWIVLVLAGNAILDRGTAQMTLARDEFVILPPQGDGTRTLLEGSGEVALIRLRADSSP